MNMVDIIIKKRDGKKLSKSEIDFFIKGVSDGSIPDYQISAMLMAIYNSSLDFMETMHLTMAMAYSGSVFDLSSIKFIKVDKHSTGGVGDSTTLILAPLVASFGVPVIKMSGRGLGFSGGTLDKLSSIPGFNVNISKEQALEFAQKSGIVLMSQTEDLAPADKKLYALRDVTGTVESMPLIISSIMSKKIAAGANAIVLDVKFGSGAFMKTEEAAEELATGMVSIGKTLGRNIVALISSMNQPLGRNIGNSLEVMEAIDILKGNTEGDLLDVALNLGAYMLILSGGAQGVEEAENQLRENIKNGKGLEKLRELIIQQGGDPSVIDDYGKLPLAPEKLVITAKVSGFVYSMDTEKIGLASVETGAGRKTKEDDVDYGAGIILKVRLGDMVNEGDVLAEIYGSTQEKCQAAADLITPAIIIKDEKPEKQELILKAIY